MNEISDTSNASQNTKPPKWFWIVSSIALIWNLLGLLAFASQMAMDTGTLPEAQRVFYDAIPMWATVAFGVAVVCGALACIALLMRRSFAVPLFMVSFIGVIVQISHSLIFSNGLEVFGTAGLVMPILTVIIAALLLGFALHSRKQGWLAV